MGGGGPTSFCAAVAGRHNAWRCAAKAINRGARSGVAISLRQYQRLVVLARWGHQSESPSGALGKRPRTGLLMDGDGVNSTIEVCAMAEPLVSGAVALVSFAGVGEGGGVGSGLRREKLLSS